RLMTDRFREIDFTDGTRRPVYEEPIGSLRDFFAEGYALDLTQSHDFWTFCPEAQYASTLVLWAKSLVCICTYTNLGSRAKNPPAWSALLTAKRLGNLPVLRVVGEPGAALYRYAWFLSFGISFVVYAVLMRGRVTMIQRAATVDQSSGVSR